MLAGCATTKNDFYSDRSTASTASLCRAHRGAVAKEAAFAQDLERELNRRGIHTFQCEAEIERQSREVGQNVAKGVAVLAVIAAAVAVSRKGGTAAASAGTTSYGQVDWDQFYDKDGVLVWRCREVQSGQFADDFRCAGLSQIDNRWPRKMALDHYRAF